MSWNNRPFRVIGVYTCCTHVVSYSPPQRQLHQLPVRQRVTFKIAVLVFQCLRGHAFYWWLKNFLGPFLGDRLILLLLVVRDAWTELQEIWRKHRPIPSGAHHVCFRYYIYFFVSKSERFQMRLHPKIEAKFLTFWPPIKITKGQGKCMSQFYHFCLGTDLWYSFDEALLDRQSY